MIKVGVLTSSRADYGIYLPLLHAMERDNSFDMKLIVFGTHVSQIHGYTINQIKKDDFTIAAHIESLVSGDSPNAIASSYALTTMKFTEFWEQHKNSFDVVFALGDRFEMAAAVAASIPYGLSIAHLYGGETTLGAIDNIYRHFITHASKWHFVSTKVFKKRIQELLDTPEKLVFDVGSLSLENLDNMPLLSTKEFYEQWQIDLTQPTILVTVHPETVTYEDNQKYCEAISEAIFELSREFQIVITMPNADTAGMLFREAFQQLARQNKQIVIVENFGTLGYFSCMAHSKLLIGNTSSGIVEAASFNKYVLNIGDRQKNRLAGDHVIHLPFNASQIIQDAKIYVSQQYQGENIYYQAQPSSKILTVLKTHYATLL